MNKQELQSLLEGVRTALTGNQSKLDRNRNNKIDSEDFTLLRSKKKPMAENADLLALLEHLYGVLLDQKAARLNEWEQPNSASHRWVKGAQANARRGQTSDPTNFYQGNREDNDEIRMSIVRAAAEEERKKREQAEKERLRGAQMENAEYDSILEKIYNLLAEEGVPPMLSPTDPNAIPLAPPQPRGWPEQVGPWRPYENPYLKNPHWINPDTSNGHRIKDPRGYPQAPPGWQGDWPWGPPTAPPSLGS